MIFQETQGPECKPNNEIGLIALWRRSRPINMITGPIIYSMVVPLLFLDICVSFYQASCFPVYNIAKVARADFFIFDRQELKYLDWVSKFHCTYCAYGVGVVAFVAAVIGRTEAYFCPIKHQARSAPPPPAAAQYIDYAQAPDFDFDAKLREIRCDMAPAPKNGAD